MSGLGGFVHVSGQICFEGRRTHVGSTSGFVKVVFHDCPVLDVIHDATLVGTDNETSKLSGMSYSCYPGIHKK